MVFALLDFIALAQKDIVREIARMSFSEVVACSLRSPGEEKQKLARIAIERVRRVVESNSELYSIIGFKEPFRHYIRNPMPELQWYKESDGESLTYPRSQHHLEERHRRR